MIEAAGSRRLPFAPGFIAGDLTNLRSAKLAGSRCRDCGVVLLGRRTRCENCSSKNLDSETFSSTGIVYTFTIQRYPPPPPFRGPSPWLPRPIGWVDLDESGPRILGPIACVPEVLKIGARVQLFFEVGWTEDSGDEFIVFGFRPCSPATATLP
jgi:uncharacterized OB-fold protein